jgi:hypothetical protein
VTETHDELVAELQHIEKLAGDMHYVESKLGENWSEEDVEMVDQLARNLRWLEEQGEQPCDERAKEVSDLVANLQWLEELGEEPTDERIKEVSDFVANLQNVESF